MQFGDVAFQLGMRPKLSLFDLLEAGNRLDGAMLRTTAADHSGGLKLIAAPADMMPLEGVPSEHVLQVVDLATREYGTVFLDLPTNWTNWSLSLVARSDLVLLVTELTVASLNRARRQLNLLRSQDLGELDVRVVLNRFDKSLARTISLADARKALGPRHRLHRRQRFPADARGDRPRRADRRDQAQDAACQGSGRARRRHRRGAGVGAVDMWQIRKPASPDAVPDEAQRQRIIDEHRLVTVGDAGAFEKRDKHTELKVELHQRLIDLINLQALDKMSRQQIEAEVGDIVYEELAKQNQALNQAERKQLVGDVLDELLGLGPLEPVLKDPTIADILVNGHNQVFVERYGKLERSPIRFKDEKHLLRIIQKIVSAVGRRIDESSPMVDARLADGSRVNAVVPPLALDGSLLSIRKFARVPISMERLIEIGSIPLQVAEVLKAIVGSRRNVLISGGTGSGKTTLLNAMSAYIDGTERIVTIEDSAELQLQQDHVVRLETRPPNIEGKGEITQRDLVKNALRMRPGPDHRRRGSRR